MAELKALSKLKMAGKLHYWRGTIEIDEYELHTICDEIQAEHDKAIAAINGSAGNWAKSDAELRKALDFMRIWISDDAHLGESAISCVLEKAEGLRKLDAIENAIAVMLGADECAEDMGAYADSLCDSIKERLDELLRCLENDWNISASWDGLRKLWNIELTEEGVRLRDAAHGTLTAEQVRGVLLLNLPHREYYSIEQTDAWQAIADELNRRAERTCRIAEGRMSESNYEKLFGTPERAAWTLAKACGECDEDLPCYECPLYPIVGNNVYEPEILEWLRGGGKVIDEEDVDLLHCSNCGACAEKQSWAYWHYCPNCGSRVVNGKEGV